jgi:hypothetical protein
LGTSDDGAVEIQDGAVQRAVVGEVEADHLQAGVRLTSTRIEGLPIRPGVLRPTSMAWPRSRRAVTNSETVTLVKPNERARSARLIGPLE